MSDDSRPLRGRPSREYDFRRWGDPSDEIDASLTDTGQRPSPWPRERAGEEVSGVVEPEVSATEFDAAPGAAAMDEPHRFDLSTYREGLYGGPGAELIGDSEYGYDWDPPRDSPEIPVAREHSQEFPPVAEPHSAESSEVEPSEAAPLPSPGPAAAGHADAWSMDAWEVPSVESTEGALPEPEPADSTLVRPYTRTGGRTRSDYNLAIEALVSTSAQGLRSLGSVSPEQQSICGLCVDTRSVAEVAAHMKLPLGVAKVLIGDMAGMGLVMVHQSSAVVGDRPSMEFLERVLSGLRRL